MRVNEQANLNTVQSDQAMEYIDQNIGGIDQSNLSMPIDVINENANSLISPRAMPIAQSSAADQAHPTMSEGTTNTNFTSDKSDQTGPETPNSQRKRGRQRKQSSSNIQRTEFYRFTSNETEEAVVKHKNQRNDQPIDQRNDKRCDQRNDQLSDQRDQPSNQRNDQPSDQRNDQPSDQGNDELNEQQSYQMLGLYDHDDQNIEPMFVDTNAPQMIDTSDFDQIAQLAGDDLMFPHPMEVYDEPNNAEEQVVMIPVGNSSQQIVAESVGKTKSNSKSGHGKSRQSADQSVRDYASPSIQQKQKAGRPKKPKIDEKTEKAKSKMGVEKAPIKSAKDKSKMLMERPSIKNKPIMITERPTMKNKSIVIPERAPMKNKSIVIPERPPMKNKSIMVTEKQKTTADKGKSIMIEEEESATDSSDEIETDGSTDKLADANAYDLVKRIRNNFKYEVSKILAMFVYRQKNELRRLYFIEWKGYEAHSRWVLSEDMNSLELLANFIEECSMSSALDAFLGAPVMSHVAKLLQKNDEAISLMQSMGKQPEEMAAEDDYFVFAKEATEDQKEKAIESIDEFVELIKKHSNDG
ncbi:hypothetical protein niasHS_006991 [Heterodera schachtii]|uniref:Chromo domain-containing protein n=2 Tax=Heterodera TaxID=34509 RepID=A0ABD2JF84_HETSC